MILLKFLFQLSYSYDGTCRLKSQSYSDNLQNAMINALIQSGAISRCSRFSREKRILRSITPTVTVSPRCFTNFRIVSRNCAWAQHTVIRGVAWSCRNSFKLVSLAGARYIYSQSTCVAGGQRTKRLHGGL